MEVPLLSTIFSIFAAAGFFLVDAVFVAATVAAMATCFAVLACQIVLWTPANFKSDPFVNGSCGCGALFGLVWSIAGIYYVGLGSAFLSVLAVCALLLFIAWATWMAREIKGYPIPDWA